MELSLKYVYLEFIRKDDSGGDFLPKNAQGTTKTKEC